MPNTKIIIFENTIQYIQFLKSCDKHQLLIIAQNSNLIPEFVDPKILPRIVDENTFQALDYHVLADVYHDKLDFSKLKQITYIFDDDGFVGRPLLTAHIKDVIESLPILFLDTYCYAIDLPNNLIENPDCLERDINELIDQCNSWGDNNPKKTSIINGLVTGYVVLHLTPIEFILALSK
jgi:hypothetical protein